jgi:hypothetical protein
MTHRLLPLLLCACAALSGCRSAYYGAMEKFGVHKREILVDRVEEGRDAQKAAKEQLKSALEAFQEVTGFRGGDLEDVYDRLNGEYESAVSKSERVTERIDAIETVAGDLFDEWQDEIRSMRDASLRRKSERLLSDTRDRYKDLIRSMKAVEDRMEPVLSDFHDHVTFLKHNLNAQAIASLRGEFTEIEADVAQLIRDMERSIAEADEFLGTLEQPAE